MSSFDGVRVDLYLRDETSPAVADQQRRARSRLEDRLGAADVAVEEHSKRVPADDEDALYSTYADVRAWADDAGVSLSPFFQRRESYDPTAQQVREMVTLPVLWLTVSERSALLATYPHVDGAVATVSDAVDDLVDDRRPPNWAAD
ncbi:hypothetical protein HWV07_02650 [Natronomonas salina]|uniref:HTH domain-containing protein n=1 Tax=Natronomonas salina TaxID=1710540 RepID=UPI0015B5DB81|nr:HTH domain-containing protein [Natronomonas salina]QLD87994.1 hypothetical protein HWV07_02650 [Natronomonas salina]